MLIGSISYFLQSLDILHICRFFSVISQFQHCTSGVLSTDPYKKDNCGDFFSNHAWDQRREDFICYRVCITMQCLHFFVPHIEYFSVDH